MSVWIKSYGTTVHKKPILAIPDGAICLSVVLTFNSVDKILCGDYSNGTSSAALSHGSKYLVCSSNF